jgi:hypothetical protein
VTVTASARNWLGQTQTRNFTTYLIEDDQLTLFIRGRDVFAENELAAFTLETTALCTGSPHDLVVSDF